MLEMFVFIFGVYAFTFGNVRLPWNLSLSGWRARVAGLFLMVPLPVLILLGRGVGQGVSSETATSFFGIMEVVIVLIGTLGAVLFAFVTRPKQRESEKNEEGANNSPGHN
jgi:protein-S-isoprenylcysteine O-methyltransferase Ste14